MLRSCALALFLTIVVATAPTSADADVTTTYAAYAASTKAFKTNWQQGYANRNGFTGNFAKTQYLTVRIAEHSYDDEEKARKALWKLGFVLRKYITVPTGVVGLGDAQAIIADDLLGRVTIVGVRGTTPDEIRDWLTDLFAVPTVFTSDATYHKGFHQYATGVMYAQIFNELERYCKPGSTRSLWLAGHSLGGAAATIIAPMLTKRGCRISGVSTFGSPRAGLENWQALYGKQGPTFRDLYYRTQRWVNDTDPIYCMPPGGKWRHVGIEDLIESNGGIRIKNNVSGSVCDTPEGWIAWLKAASIAAFPVGYAGTLIGRAILAWAAGIIEIGIQCDEDSLWDDVWSLGGCTLVDVGGDLAASFGITPDELITETARLIVSSGDHGVAGYSDGFGEVNFDAPTNESYYLPYVRVLKVTVGAGYQYAEPTLDWRVVVFDKLTGQHCMAQGGTTVTCNFQVPLGETVSLHAVVGSSWTSSSWEGVLCTGDAEEPCTWQVASDAEVRWNGLVLF